MLRQIQRVAERFRDVTVDLNRRQIQNREQRLLQFTHAALDDSRFLKVSGHLFRFKGARHHDVCLEIALAGCREWCIFTFQSSSLLACFGFVGVSAQEENTKVSIAIPRMLIFMSLILTANKTRFHDNNHDNKNNSNNNNDNSNNWNDQTSLSKKSYREYHKMA